jgi:hypothetical protein
MLDFSLPGNDGFGPGQACLSEGQRIRTNLLKHFITLFKVNPDYLTPVGSYIHVGKALTNGAIDLTQVITDSNELTLVPEDDGLQIVDYVKGDFEWWYFESMVFREK